ncbi:tetratricopeptide repeat protein [Opitutus sp. ER46]|uniref:ATP-binding protein n=1 Tax=Opitutus sp. ER46 TaxID=2161864 RepID=UPI001304DC08|nr:tetratricopeptide repeat protein [Opitutus sp. ER46]
MPRLPWLLFCVAVPCPAVGAAELPAKAPAAAVTTTESLGLSTAEAVEHENEVEPPSGDEVYAAAQQALAQAKGARERLRALHTVANLQRRRGDFAEGLSSAQEGLAEARRLGNLRLEVDFLYLVGRMHWNLSDFPRALQSHLEELRKAEELGDLARLARTHAGLGLTYHRFGRSDDARHHFELGLQLAEKAGDDRVRSSILFSLGNYYLGEANLSQAVNLHEQALALRRSHGNRRAIAASLTSLGTIAEEQGLLERAREYFAQALENFEALNYRRYIANTQRRMAEVLRKLGRTDEGLRHLRAALEVAATLNSAEVSADLYREAALTHEARGEFALALGFERRLAEAREQMRNELDRRTVAELHARYRAEQRELEITLLKRDQELQQAELRRRRFQNVALGLGLIGGVSLLGAVVFVQLQRLRAERRLRAAHEHARAQAESADRLKTRLLQMAAHDLKVPLTALHAAAAHIGDAPGADAEVRQLAAGIQSDTARMRGLVRDFLDAAAQEEGNLQLHVAELDLPALVRSAVERLRPVAAEKRQQLHCPPASALPLVRADADRLHQVFDNLIGNALKFTPIDGEIFITFGVAGAWAFAEVRDTGPGFGPEDFARIFSPGEPLATKPTGEEDSTGMGLFIARELLTLQGGRLEVQSKLGEGAVFRVLLPTVPGGQA